MLTNVELTPPDVMIAVARLLLKSIAEIPCNIRNH
jgi:hypothetical protein